MKSLALLTFVACAAACSNSNSANEDMMSVADLSASGSPDLSASGVDMSVLTGCHGLAMCIGACNGNTTCDMTCRADATTKAKQLYKSLRDCRQATCYPQDGGTGPCMTGVAPSANCMLCLKDADTAPGMCASGMTSWCGACYSEFSACAADLP
jgi:hypothetical protein